MEIDNPKISTCLSASAMMLRDISGIAQSRETPNRIADLDSAQPGRMRPGRIFNADVECPRDKAPGLRPAEMGF